MTKVARSSLLAVGLVALMCGFTASQPVFAGGGAAPRLILSYADALEPALSSVVRVEAFSAPNPAGAAPSSIGSGVVIEAGRGLILTNAHVVSGAKSFRIQLRDGRWYDAKLAGVDVPTDLAMLRAGKATLRAIGIADSDAARVGDVVFAVGYPFGLEQTLTMGVVSGLGRPGEGKSLADFIQTDAAINSGNSGGPLLDSEGRLIGINTAILSRSGGSIGIGFSIPSRVALEVASQLADFGEVRRGGIGVVLDKVSEEASAKAGTSNWQGALVASVDPGSPAAVAGLKAGDVIISFNSRQVRSATGLRTWIGVSRTGVALEIGYMRSGVATKVFIVPQPLKPLVVSGLGELGAFLRPTGPDDKLPQGVEGAVVIEIVPESPAALSGLQVGDVILTVNGEPVTTPQVCDRLISEAHGRALLMIYRAGAIRPLIIQHA